MAGRGVLADGGFALVYNRMSIIGHDRRFEDHSLTQVKHSYGLAPADDREFGMIGHRVCLVLVVGQRQNHGPGWIHVPDLPFLLELEPC